MTVHRFLICSCLLFISSFALASNKSRLALSSAPAAHTADVAKLGLVPNSSAKVGDWIQGCFATNDEDYLSGLALIDQKEFLWFAFAYEDENCKQAYLIFSRKFKTIDLEKSLFEVTSVTYRSLTDEVTEALNLIAFCGYRDWQTYQEKEVTGRVCDDFTPAKKGETQMIDLQLRDGLLFIDRSQIEYRRIQYTVL